MLGIEEAISKEVSDMNPFGLSKAISGQSEIRDNQPVFRHSGKDASPYRGGPGK